MRRKCLVSYVNNNFCECCASALHILQNEKKFFGKQFSCSYSIIEKATSAQHKIFQYHICHIYCLCASSKNKLLLKKVVKENSHYFFGQLPVELSACKPQR